MYKSAKARHFGYSITRDHIYALCKKFSAPFYHRLIRKMGGKKKWGESGGTKKVPTFSKTKKNGDSQKKSGHEVGILRKTHFFPYMGTLTNKKNRIWEKITDFLKVGVPNKRKSERTVSVPHFLKVGIPPPLKKKKKRCARPPFFRKKKIHLP